MKDLNKHIKENHTKFRYKCTYCTRRFLNYASRYKHERKHGTPSHICGQCQKGFFFKKDLTAHYRIHSGKGLFRCTNCTNTYTTRAAMDTHRLVHQQQKYLCDKCNFTMDTTANLRQHERGRHRRGWKAACGKRYDWPAKMFHHKRKCAQCLNIKEKAAKNHEKIEAKLWKKNPSSIISKYKEQFQLLSVNISGYFSTWYVDNIFQSREYQLL